MTYRIDIKRTAEAALVLVFQGLLDEAALEDLQTRIAAAGVPARLLLCAGTEVIPGCVEGLRDLPQTSIEAESPFLRTWLSQGR